MADPGEGVAADGTIRTGGMRDRVPAAFEPVLADAVAMAAERLGVRAARKTLLAAAGMVSVRDHTWTTGRARAVQRWSQVEPGLAAPLRA